MPIKRSFLYDFLPVVCVAGKQPAIRTSITHPGKPWYSEITNISRGSPSSPWVPGIKPKSNGNTRPGESTFLRRKSFRFLSYVYFWRLPFGVSIMISIVQVLAFIHQMMYLDIDTMHTYTNTMIKIFPVK